jgi:hemerythrin superfamily protein
MARIVHRLDFNVTKVKPITTTNSRLAKPEAALLRDHARLESLLSDLAADAEGNDPTRLQKTWSEFESCLARHLREEEQQLLPRFLPSYPEEARTILTEHQRIRELVSELGIEVDLHTLRKQTLDRLIRMLQVHARAEERGLYAWARKLSTPLGG